MKQTVTLGGGCFWCLDAAYRMVNGVSDVMVGYAGGHQPDPIYEQVSTGTTGHAEVARVTFDDRVVSLDDILSVFWTIHDPTTPDRQGYDIGPQYRSCIFYETEDQRLAAEASKAQIQKSWKNPVVTEIAPLDKFYPAEDYHQEYFSKNPEAGYCQVVINPKLAHLREAAAQLLK